MYVKNRTKVKVKKVVALFVLFTIFNQIFAPGIAYALTAGPTAPEATNFEPVDTTDMVNPLTGDFTYNLPLIEVPGPEGSYPLSLSYHADIQPNEEASWVGLGWSLNPGAIARNVNGYPDDWSNVYGVERTFWGGGHTETIGLNVGIGMGTASVNFGLSFAQDTYRGFGVGTSFGAGFALAGSPFNAGVSIGISAFGEGYVGTNIGVSSGGGANGLNGSADIGLTTNFKQATVGVGASVGNGSLQGASISSSGGKTTASIGGATSSVNNANEGKIQTESTGSSFTLPIPVVSLGVSYNYTRYWSDESTVVQTNGVLYGPNPSTISNSSYFNTNAFDTYRILNTQQTNIIDNPDPDRIVGGTYPNFDDYSVTAQGLSGNMRPYAFQNILYSQNKINDSNHSNDVIENVSNSVNITTKNNFQFRFVNDFSNKYTQQASYDPNQFLFDTNPIYGNTANDGGYNTTNNQLEGSRHIEYFTNQEIVDSYNNSNSTNRVITLGFINTDAGGFARKYDKQIGGFMITNASGVTYHYALPAYSSNELVHTEKIDPSQGPQFNDLHKDAPYAYTWYLTAITGPDYVDTNHDGKVDANDWGYWVKFDYGKWADNYQWRNPSAGFHKDLDNDFKSYSSGLKEVYYLDAISTRTHTAIFEKEIRADGKSGNGVINSFNTDLQFNVYGQSYCPYIDGNGNAVVPPEGTQQNYYNIYPKASLRLNNIYLFNNSDLPSINSIRTASDNYVHLFNFSAINSNNSCSQSQRVHYGENVIDKFDLDPGISGNSALLAKCLRKIAFNYDYSLCPGTPNSYDPGGLNTYIPNPYDPLNNNFASPLLGKLTLLSVDFQGKGGAETMPPIEFQYDLDPTAAVNKDNIDVYQIAQDKTATLYEYTAGKFSVGDILSFSVNGVKYYCVLLSTFLSNYFNVRFLDQIPGANISSAAAVKTKNPPYNKDAFDLWGCYKSDYVTSSNENLSRLTTQVSNNSTDVWSLRKIKSSLGSEININYEGDTYSHSVLNKDLSLIVTNINPVSPQNFSMTINNENLDIGKIFHPGDKIDLLILKELDFDYVPNVYYKPKNSKNYTAESVTINSITGNNIQVHTGPQMYNDLITLNDADGYNFGRIHYYTGNISTNVNSRFYGGGLRVKNIITDNLNGEQRETAYDYTPLNGDQNFSSGVTSYEPLVFDVDGAAQYGSDAKNAYRKELYKNINYLLPLGREVPAPGVTYEFVTESDYNLVADATQATGYKSIPVGGKTVYQFEVFNLGMLGLEDYYFNSTATTRRLNVSIKDFTSRIGNLKRMITYDDKGNKLSEKINHYLHDDIADKSFETQVQSYEPRLAAYNNIGVIQERYADARTVYESGTAIDKSLMSGRDIYPAIQTGTTQIDYKNGTRIDQKNLAFDFYTGSVVKTQTTDSYGNKFVNEVTPAYQAYSGMGLKTLAASNKHMLTQEASNYTFKVDDAGNKLGVVTASAQTWDNQIPVVDQDGNATTTGQANIWRMKANYSWMSTGIATNNITPISSFVDYFSNGSSNAAWKKTAEITLYNVYSNSLEATDINTNYAATRMGYGNSKVIISGGPAKYKELAYAGAEDALLSNGNFSTQISSGSGTINTDTTYTHTGVKSLKLAAGQSGFTYTLPVSSITAQDYSVAVWVKPTSSNANQALLYYQVGGASIVSPTQTLAKNAAGWYLLEMRIPASVISTGSGNLVVGCKNNGSSGDLYFDDFRFQPNTSGASAYVYDNHTGELTYIIGNNNLFTRFQYDAAGRLIRTYKEVLGKSAIPLIHATVYNYGKGHS